MSAALDWLATYLVHSTVLLGAAWLIDCALGRRLPQVAETVWRTAVLGAVLTATLHSLPFGPTGPGEVLGGAPTASTPAPTTLRSLPVPAAPRRLHPPRRAMAAAAVTGPLVATVWLLGVALGATRIGLAAVALGRLLDQRRPRPPGRVLRQLASQLGIRRRVAVSTSLAIPVPFTIGIRQPEVCCPERLMSELSGPLQRGILAHELAHVARHDVLWRRLLLGLAALLWVQPLLHVARRRLHTLGEILCDRRAAACTGRPRDLAACLVEVAGRAGASLLPLAAIAPGRELDHRVTRLLEDSMTEPRSSRALALAATLALLTTGALLPAASWTAAEAPPAAPAAPAATAAPAPAVVPDPPPTAMAPVAPAATPQQVAAAAAPPAPPAPEAVPPDDLEAAIVDALVTKSLVDPDVDPDEVRRVVEEVIARESARRQRDVERRLRDAERRERQRTARDSEADAHRAETESRVQQLVERQMAARQAEVEARAAALAADRQAADSAELAARAAALEAQARALAEQRDQLREEARRLAEEAARSHDEQPEPEQR